MVYRFFIIFSLFLFTTHRAASQLQADFSLNKNGGCSPLEIVFTNTTTGASAAAVYQWDFDNGNSSTLEDPSATYINEGTYIITLTVSDGGNYSTRSKNVTVYQKPSVDFNVNPGRGCVPLNVIFTSTSTPGDGDIANYLWDFGDGHTLEGATLNKTSHTYTSPQKPPVNLTVTNSFGCYASTNRNGLVDVYPKLSADFTPSAALLCSPGVITFNNSSTGGGNLLYSWDFGDGKTSAAKSPSHDYTSAGKFTVKLTVSNEVGCSVDAKTQTINISAFDADFSVLQVACSSPALTSFSNKSSRPYKSLQWFVDDDEVSFNQSNGNLNYRFPSAGSYNIKLRVDFNGCVDSVAKKITVGATPDLKGFLIAADDLCAMPVTYTFTDTTPGIARWTWRYKDDKEIFDSASVAVLTMSESGSDRIGVTVTTAEGCISQTVKKIDYYNTNVAIVIKKSNSASQSGNSGCPGLNLTFSTTPAQEVVDFSWRFGDGAVSTVKEPSHTYTNHGSYQVRLDFVTKNGCKGTATFDSIHINNVKPIDFSVSPSPFICGNSETTFTPEEPLANRDYIWLIDGKKVNESSAGDAFIHRFEEAGVYTISLVIQSGSCRDTVTKVDYVTVVPPFPKIKSVQHTCTGDRGLVTFRDITKGTTKWTWEFGDGESVSYDSFEPVVTHNFRQTGTYKVKLTAVNGICTVADSVFVPVLLKQQPLLAMDVAELCTSDSPSVSVSNFETHPVNGGVAPYKITKLQFADLSSSNATLSTGNWDTSFTGIIYGLETAKKDLRIITTSSYFGCEDTSNFVGLKVTGPVAKIVFDKLFCLGDKVALIDSSYSDPESPIVSKEWLYEAGAGNGGPEQDQVTAFFDKPGVYPVGLKVTDKNGCSHQTPADNAHLITVSGPAADFEVSSYSVFENTLVDFKNTSRHFDNSGLEWHFSDGSIISDQKASFFYDEEGSYPVKLIATHRQTGCSDTAAKAIEVKKLRSFFTYDVLYTNLDNCPPLLVNFKSQSINATRVSWSFGDGGEGGDQLEVNHVYTSAGTYTVVHYSYDDRGRIDSTIRLLEVKGPYATLQADTLFGCKQLEVRLRAETFDAVSFKWDFGDGVIIPTKDTFATHTYLTPGIYMPALILTDSVGCSAPSRLGSQIIIDSLAFRITVLPDAPACDSGVFKFTSNVKCFSQQRLQAPVSYNWTSNLHTNTVMQNSSSWHFNKVGFHEVQLEVTSTYGCKEQVSKQVEIKLGVIAAIDCNKDICLGDSAYVKGLATPPGGTLKWKWEIGSGITSNLQRPAPFTPARTGPYPVSLVVDNGFCKDTVTYAINVQPPPPVTLRASKQFVCLGDTVSLHATGGLTVRWSPPGINEPAGDALVASPPVTGYFAAIVTDSLGCSSTDSIRVEVVHPLTIDAPTNLFGCYGTPVQLGVSGAASYEWSGNGLSSTARNPVVQPKQTSTYQVVGFDSFNCFSDTAMVLVNVVKLPSVNAGPNKQSIAGEEILLSTSHSSDVVKWNWQPATDLSCSTCSDTKAKPEVSTNYVVSVVNDMGCVASDTISVEMLCGSNYIHVPTAFTPNGDNLNDRFRVRGGGVVIKRLAIFDRWGKIVFERRDVSALDRNSAWDGTFNGQPLASGGYVYMLEAVCEKGDAFTFKGIVTLIR